VRLVNKAADEIKTTTFFQIVGSKGKKSFQQPVTN
jgi:hypothetical protein